MHKLDRFKLQRRKFTPEVPVDITISIAKFQTPAEEVYTLFTRSDLDCRKIVSNSSGGSLHFARALNFWNALSFKLQRRKFTPFYHLGVDVLAMFQTPAEEVYTAVCLQLLGVAWASFKLQRRKFTLCLYLCLFRFYFVSNSSGGSLHEMQLSSKIKDFASFKLQRRKFTQENHT